MKKSAYIILALLVIVFAFLGISYLFIQSKLKSHIIPEISRIIKAETDIDVSFSNIRFSFSKLMQFEPAIKITGLKISEGFSAERIHAILYIRPLIQRKFVIKELIINNAYISLVENSKKEVFLKGIDMNKLAQKLKANAQAKNKSGSSKEPDEAFITNISLNKVYVNNSIIDFLAYGQSQPIKLTKVEIMLEDFEMDENGITSKLEFDSRLFNSSRSVLQLKGDMGPFPETLTELPIKGTQILRINMQDIPEKILQENFGDMIKLRSNAVIEQNAWISGNVFGTMYGDGKARIKNLEIGASDKHTLIIDSELPLKFDIRMNIDPTLRLESRASSIDLQNKGSNKGILKADNFITIKLDTGMVDVSSRGSIKGLELEDTLAAFANLENIISGKFELEDYQVSFKGKDPQQIEQSLQGSGRIKINNGSLYILRSITRYSDIAKTLINNGDQITEKLAGDFLELSSDIEISNRNLHTRNISLASADNISITGSGVVKKSEFLVYDIDLKLPRLTPIPIKIRGTLEKPSIYPDMKSIGARQGQDLINSALQQGLNILNKSLKTAPNTNAEPSSMDTGTTEDASTVPALNLPGLPKVNKPTKQEVERAAKQLLFNVLDGLKEQQPAPRETAPTSTGIAD
jgi:hypothetical protein